MLLVLSADFHLVSEDGVSKLCQYPGYFIPERRDYLDGILCQHCLFKVSRHTFVAKNFYGRENKR